MKSMWVGRFNFGTIWVIFKTPHWYFEECLQRNQMWWLIRFKLAWRFSGKEAFSMDFFFFLAVLVRWMLSWGWVLTVSMGVLSKSWSPDPLGYVLVPLTRIVGRNTVWNHRMLGPTHMHKCNVHIYVWFWKRILGSWLIEPPRKRRLGRRYPRHLKKICSLPHLNGGPLSGGAANMWLDWKNPSDCGERSFKKNGMVILRHSIFPDFPKWLTFSMNQIQYNWQYIALYIMYLLVPLKFGFFPHHFHEEKKQSHNFWGFFHQPRFKSEFGALKPNANFPLFPLRYRLGWTLTHPHFWDAEAILFSAMTLFIVTWKRTWAGAVQGLLVFFFFWLSSLEEIFNRDDEYWG